MSYWRRGGFGNPRRFGSAMVVPLMLLGVIGSGKTTAIARLAEGLLQMGWAVLFLDCSGSGLRHTAKELTDRVGNCLPLDRPYPSPTSPFATTHAPAHPATSATS